MCIHLGSLHLIKIIIPLVKLMFDRLYPCRHVCMLQLTRPYAHKHTNKRTNNEAGRSVGKSPSPLAMAGLAP